MSLAVFELPQVKVSKDVVDLVKDMIRGGFYRLGEEEKEEGIRILSRNLSLLYEVKNPSIEFGKMLSNSYRPSTQEIRLTNTSLISFLHEYRHHLQRSKGLKYKDLTIEQDARAWSLRVYSKAVPKMFERAVKNRKVAHVKWDNELNKVVDDCLYI